MNRDSVSRRCLEAVRCECGDVATEQVWLDLPFVETCVFTGCYPCAREHEQRLQDALPVRGSRAADSA